MVCKHEEASMAKNYVQPGKVMEFTAGAAISSGAGVLIGDRFGVANGDVASGAKGEAAVEGVFNVTKLATDVVAEGVALYWDAGNSRLTITPSTHKLAGYAFAAAGNGVATVDIKLNG